MSFSTFRVVSAFKDPSKINIFNEQIDANRNIVAILEFLNDNPQGDNVRYYAIGNDLTDNRIDAQARDIIRTLNEQEAALAALTIGGPMKTPKPIDQKLLVLQAAQTAFSKASQAAMVRFRNDPDEIQAYADLVIAQDAIKTP